MSFAFPNNTKFTIYTKTNCKYCTQVKILLEDNNIEYETINCDNYLTNNRELFLDFIKTIAQKEWKSFPMVFDDKGSFIGGFDDTQNYLKKIINFDNTTDF